MRLERRSVLQAGAAGAAALFGLEDLSRALGLRPVARAEAAQGRSPVRFGGGIEPLVRWLEDTPRDGMIEEAARRIRAGLSYREMLAALQLAAIRNVQPRPAVGFKFHAVLVVHSAHLASLEAPDGDRWLPILWAIDYFKSSQARDVQEGDWTMAAVDESRVPGPAKAGEELVKALDAWDVEAADAAVAGFVRASGVDAVFEVLFRYGARDYRSIGHKAIWVANARRVLETIGLEHAEPICRSLVYAMLAHTGEENPAKTDVVADRSFRRHLEVVDALPADWMAGRVDDGATRAVISSARDADEKGLSELVVELLRKDVAPTSIWDGLFVASAELVARQPAIVPLHAVTTTNAIHHAWRAVADDRSRRLLLLQNASFLALFRGSAQARWGLGELRLDTLESGEAPESGPAGLLTRLGESRAEASRSTLAWLEKGGDAGELVDAARSLVFLKGDDAHDYKYGSAVFEDYRAVSKAWRSRYLAGAMHLWCHPGQRDNPMVARIRRGLTAS